jgi:cytochrome c oxidase subunit 3
MATTIASTHATVLPQPKKVATAVGYTNADRASRSGIWIGIFAITMSFAAFTSALFVRQGTNDWTHLVLPSLLYVNTVVLLASSATFELSRRSLTGGALIEYAGARKALGWLAVTLVLGLAFCVGQFMVWQQLRAAGIYLATNPNSSFFYVLTVIHALHVLAGIIALV